MPDERIVYLPFLRREFPIDLNGTEGSNLTGTLRLEVRGQKEIDPSDEVDRLQNTEHTITFFGPGDVEDINPGAFARREPPPNTKDFEPNLFPFIEFRDPDFIWRYSLDSFETDNPVPWLALVVLSGEELKELETELASYPFFKDADGYERLKVKRELLPDFVSGNAWNWTPAHVQLNEYPEIISNDEDDPSGSLTEEELAERALDFIEKNPEKHLCRLFCLRKLQPEKTYTAFLVPLYRSAMGAGPGDKSFAFEGTPGDILEFRVYDRWSFMTAEKGDFEYLARKLKSAEVPEGTGTRPAETSINFDDPNPIAHRFFLREGALSAPFFSQSEGEPGGRKSFKEHINERERTEEIRRKVNLNAQNLIDNEITEVDDAPDPIVTMPYYGKPFQKASALSDERSSAEDSFPWKVEANLDQRSRTAAGMGTKTIQNKQEDYVRECWNQVGDLRMANEKFRLAKAGLELSRAIEQKHFKVLSDERFTLRTAAFQSHCALNETGDSVSFKKFFRESGLSSGLIQPAFSKIAHQAIGLNQVDLFQPWRLAKSRAAKNKGFFCGILNWFSEIGKKIAESFCQKPNRPYDLAERWKRTFHTSLPDLLELFPFVQIPKQEIIPVTPIDIGQDFRPKLDVAKTIRKKILSLIRLNGERDLGTIWDSAEQIVESPTIDESMYIPLRDQSQDYILPGLDGIEMNTVTLCEENRRFIQTYMLGCNQEMGNELAFRKFPIDPRGTIFSYFWNPTQYDPGVEDDLGKPAPKKDIKDIHIWKNELGNNHPNSDSDEAGRVVLVIKADLVRRYPDTIYYAVKITESHEDESRAQYWTEIYPNDDSETSPGGIEEENHEEIFPTFRGQIGPDVLAVGFPFTVDDLKNPNSQYYFVLQQNRERSMYGLDLATAPAPGETLNEGFTWNNVNLNDSGYINDWSGISPQPENASDIAHATYQKPIQMVIHASQLVDLNS